MRGVTLGCVVLGLLAAAFSSAAQALTFDDFVALPEVETAAIAPDAKHFMTFQPVAGRRSVVIYNVGGGQCAFAPNDVQIVGAYWANSKYLLISAMVSQIKFSLFGD